MSLPSTFVTMDMVRLMESAEILPNVAYIPEHGRLHPELGCTQEPIAGGQMFYAGPGSPLNHAVGMGLNGPVSREEFERFENFYRDRKVPAEIVLAPYVDRSVLEHVHERHYKLNEFNSVLWRKIEKGMRLPATRDGLEVRKVKREESRLWEDILGQGFADLGPLPPGLFETFAHVNNSLSVLAYVDGKPAGGGGGAYFPEIGMCCLFGASTIPEFRRRGVQAAMTYERVRMAAKAGCTIAVVMTQPGSGSQRNMERQGFRVAYTKFVMVKEWDNAAASVTT
jgi:hypothetical protein